MIPVRSIRIGPFDVAIKQMASDNALGIYKPADQTIYLLETYGSPQQEAETALHEILHAICDIYSIRPKDGEERTVHLMSVGISSLIRDNPDFIRWLRHSLDQASSN